MAAQTTNNGYLPIDLIKVALCPLSFHPQTLKEHILYNGNAQSPASIKKDKSLEHLEVGDSLDEWRTFKYWTKSKNRAIGSVNIKAPYGMAPHDFDVLVGLYNHCRELHREGVLPEDGQLEFRLAELARLCHINPNGGKQANRLRSSVFRLNFFTLHSTAEWSSEAQEYGHKTIKLFTVKYLSRLGKVKGAGKNHDLLVLQLDRSFLDLVATNQVIQFDLDFFRTLSAKHKRHYLQSVRFGWWDRNSPPDIDAEEYAINQIWMTDADQRLQRSGIEVSSRQRRSSHRIDWMKRLCREAEALNYIEPTKKSGWNGKYLKPATEQGSAPCYFVRWKSGKQINNKKDLQSKSKLRDDALWQRVSVLRDDRGQPPTPQTFHQWEKSYGRVKLGEQLDILQWMQETKKPFTKSAVQTLVNRLENNYSAPDAYREQTQMNMFASTEITRDPRLQQAYNNIIK